MGNRLYQMGEMAWQFKRLQYKSHWFQLGRLEIRSKIIIYLLISDKITIYNFTF